jgi:hypothetical protein
MYSVSLWVRTWSVFLLIFHLFLVFIFSVFLLPVPTGLEVALGGDLRSCSDPSQKGSEVMTLTSRELREGLDLKRKRIIQIRSWNSLENIGSLFVSDLSHFQTNLT